MFLRRSWVLGVALATGLGCVACGNSSVQQAAPATSAASTSAELAADRVAEEIRAAYQGTSVVHVRGTVTQGTEKTDIDVQFNKDSAGGTIVQGGAKVLLRRVGTVTYVQMTDDVLKMAGLSPATSPGRLMRNKWLSSESKFGAELVSGTKDLFSYDEFISHTLGQIKPGTFIAGGRDTVDGVPVLVFKATDGTVEVAEASPHYLIRATDSTGTLDFTDWDKSAPVTAPAAEEMYSGPGA